MAPKQKMWSDMTEAERDAILADPTCSDNAFLVYVGGSYELEEASHGCSTLADTIGSDMKPQLIAMLRAEWQSMCSVQRKGALRVMRLYVKPFRIAKMLGLSKQRIAQLLEDIST